MIVFFDIDGTLIGRGRGISPKTLEALERAKAKGHYLIIASGRTKGNLPEEIRRFPWDGYLLGSGMYGEFKNQVFLQEEIPLEPLRELLQYISRRSEIDVVLENNKGSYLKKAGAVRLREILLRLGFSTVSQVNEAMQNFILVEDFEEVTPVSKLMYFSEGWSYREMITRFQEKFDFYPNSVIQGKDYQNGEIQKKAVTKGYGVDKFLAYTGFKKADTVAFGDGFNDIEMLQTVNTGVAMRNGVKDLKEVADYITESQENEGVYYGLEHLQLI